MKHAKQSTDIKPTPGSVNADVIGSRSSPSVTSVIPSTCTRITSEDVAHIPLWEPSSLLRKSMQFCKTTTVMTVVLTHYMKLNTIRTISCGRKTDNSCSVHSVEQKSIGLKFSKSGTRSDVRYSCHHTSSCFTFPIFAHLWHFSVVHSLQSHHIRINRKQYI